MMDTQTAVNCVLIVAGAIIMLISITGSKSLIASLPFVPERQRRHIKRYLLLHRGLMGFFLCGYLVVLAGFVFDYPFVSETFVSLIFLFGAIFVFIGVDVQSRLMSGVQSTLRGLLPICCRCKKVRAKDADCNDPQAWKEIEGYISENANVDFTHSYCPECYQDELKNIESMDERP